VAPQFPARPQADLSGHPDSAQPWRLIIDGWVRDPHIRRDVLVSLVALLITVVIVVGIALSSGVGLLTSATGRLAFGAGPSRVSWLDLGV
jgi:hypothetical protein